MPADRRLFDSSAMTPPPAPEIDAVTNNAESRRCQNRCGLRSTRESHIPRRRHRHSGRH